MRAPRLEQNSSVQYKRFIEFNLDVFCDWFMYKNDNPISALLYAVLMMNLLEMVVSNQK